MFRRLCPVIVALAVAMPCGSRAAREFELLSRTLIEGPSRTVAFFDRGVILGTGGGIVVFPDDGTLRNPAFLPIDGEPREILIEGSTAYVAAADGGLVTVDLSDVAHPRETSRYRTPQAMSCASAGGMLFLADLRGNLFVFSLENPREPSLRETKKLPMSALSLSADGNTLCVALQRKAELFRAMPGGALQKLSAVSVAGDVKKALMRDGILYLLTSRGELACWDFAKGDKPAALKPVQAKNITDIAIGDGGGFLLANAQFIVPFTVERKGGFRMGRGHAKIKTGKGFNLTSIRRDGGASGRSASAAFEKQKPTGIAMARNRLAIFSPFDGMRLCEVEGDRSRLLDAFATRGFAVDLVAARGLLYVANANDGVRIGRLDANGSVDWIGHIQTIEARDIALSGTTLVIADGAGGIKIADVSDPRKAMIVGRHASPYFMSAVVVQGARAYCAGGLGGVEVVDCADPKRPKLVWRADFSEVRGIWTDRRYLYFADGNAGFRIFSIEGAKSASVSVLDTPGWNCDVFVEKDTAYLADGGGGIIVVDIGDRKNPRAAGSLFLDTVTREIHLRGKTLFAAGYTKGIAAIDVSNPASPSVEAWFRSVDDARGVFADENFVYLASGSGGVYIFKYPR